MAGRTLPATLSTSTTSTSNYLKVSFAYLAVFFAYYPTTQVLFERWIQFDESMSHGLLIVGLSIHLVVKRLSEQSKPLDNVNRISPFCLALSLSLIWGMFTAASIDIIEQLLIPAILWAILATLFGVGVGKRILLPVSFMYFAIPLWDYFNQVLVEISSSVVGFLVELSGITAYISGPNIELAHGVLVIAGGCSGLRYFTISLALSSYLALDSTSTNTKKLFVIILAAISALVANWVRIFWIVMAADLSDMQSSLIHDHEYFGWGVFAVLLAPSLYYGTKLLPPREQRETFFNLPLKSTMIGSILSGSVLIFALAIYPMMAASIDTTGASLDFQDFEVSKQKKDWLNADSIYQRHTFINANRLSSLIFLNTKQHSREKLVPFISGASPLHRQGCSVLWHFVSGYWTTSYFKAKLLQALPGYTENPIYAAILVYSEGHSDCDQIAAEVDKEVDLIKAKISASF
jgi:exosortase